ncbi:MAG: glucose-1-phosphate cytidylyltransferase [Propionibacteriales bacterium]|nr:glucose-1-phosphate cytidylyltransferase [Propionibacteriales bacterium]
MKVVLFCGGYGMRMRGGADDLLPKPMQMVGPRPLLWHVMRYYAHFGYTDFVLCLGYGASVIKDFFLHYEETASNDFVLDQGQVQMLGTDLSQWRITFVQTGLETPIGERLRRVREHLEGEEIFLANYADVLSDVDLHAMVGAFEARPTMVGGMLAVPPQSSFHVLDMFDDHKVHGIRAVADMPIWENGGYLVFRSEVFEHLEQGKDLVADTCAALASSGRLMAQQHTGFWKPADTYKERAELEALWTSGRAPWVRWGTGEPCPH